MLRSTIFLNKFHTIRPWNKVRQFCAEGPTSLDDFPTLAKIRKIDSQILFMKQGLIIGFGNLLCPDLRAGLAYLINLGYQRIDVSPVTGFQEFGNLLPGQEVMMNRRKDERTKRRLLPP